MDKDLEKVFARFSDVRFWMSVLMYNESFTPDQKNKLIEAYKIINNVWCKFDKDRVLDKIRNSRINIKMEEDKIDK